MAERFVFPLRFEENEMREAVNAFTKRALLTEQPLKTLAPAALIFLACIMLALSGEEENAARRWSARGGISPRRGFWTRAW